MPGQFTELPPPGGDPGIYSALLFAPSRRLPESQELKLDRRASYVRVSGVCVCVGEGGHTRVCDRVHVCAGALRRDRYHNDGPKVLLRNLPLQFYSVLSLSLSHVPRNLFRARIETPSSSPPPRAFLPSFAIADSAVSLTDITVNSCIPAGTLATDSPSILTASRGRPRPRGRTSINQRRKLGR